MSKAGVQVLYNSHIIESKDEITILFKIVIGLDQEARGTISNTYREKNIRNIPKEEQVSECLRRIREETRDKRAVLELIKDKTEYTWFEGDSYIGWYLKGKIAEYADIGDEIKRSEMQALLGMLIRLDTVFIAMVYFMSFIALIFWKNEESNFNVFILIIWLVMEWVSVHFFIEVQSRYRYPAMPAFMFLAACGIWLVYNKAKMFRESAEAIIKLKLRQKE